MGNFGKLPLNCPPPKAIGTSNQIMYRFVNSDPPTPSDFISLKKKNPGKQYPNSTLECQACGLSLYTKKQDAIEVKKKIPRLRKLKIARGTLSPNSGVIKHTPSHNSQCHYTWWMHINQQPWNYFQVI